ncbi:3'-5'-exoribonuclease [Binucleata daphniae]
MSFTKALLQKNKREDNRSLDELTKFNYEKYDSSFLFSSPNAQILISCHSIITKPNSDNPHQGIVRMYCKAQQSNKINNLLKKIYIKSRCIDLDMLSIEYGKKCYEVTFEVKVIYSNGFPLNLVVEGLNITIENYKFETKVCVNFVPKAYYFVKCDKWILEPTNEEEDIKEAECVIVTGNNNIILIEKLGSECSANDLFELVNKCQNNQIKRL